MRPTSRIKGNQTKTLGNPLYNKVREGEFPLNFTGDIDYFVNKEQDKEQINMILLYLILKWKHPPVTFINTVILANRPGECFV
jgi:hypothetical protein